MVSLLLKRIDVLLILLSVKQALVRWNCSISIVLKTLPISWKVCSDQISPYLQSLIECKEKGWRVVGTGFDKTNPKFKEITNIDFNSNVFFYIIFPIQPFSNRIMLFWCLDLSIKVWVKNYWIIRLKSPISAMEWLQKSTNSPILFWIL